MKKILFLLLFVSFLFSCQNQKPADSEVVTPYVEETPAIEPAKSIPKTKYVFTVFVTHEPLELVTSSYDYSKYIEKGYRQYVLDIEELTDSITEDFKYRFLDVVEKDLRENKLKAVASYYTSVATAYNISPSYAEVQIKSRDIFIFDSYKDASIARQEAIQNEQYISKN